MTRQFCPKCGSDYVSPYPRHGRWRCFEDGCGAEWTDQETDRLGIVGRGVSLSEADDPHIQRACRDLAERTTWVTDIAESWPAPIAHEYHRLREEVEIGRVLGVIWQFKDVCEVLIKLPAIVMARATMVGDSHWTCSTAELRRELAVRLLQKPLSMGDWLQLADTTLAQALCHQEGLVGGLARLFRTRGRGKPKQTALTQNLRESIGWRNDVLGHGALRLKVSRYLGELEGLLLGLNCALETESVRGVWKEARLMTSDGTTLHGWSEIRRFHESEQDRHHELDVGLCLDWEGRQLELLPLLGLRRCRVCDKQDVFFFDHRRGEANKCRLYFLDYLAGHRMQCPGHLEPELAQPVPGSTTFPETGHSASSDYHQRSVDDLLAGKALETHYLSPTYLRETIRSFVEGREKGVCWLRAPAHIGKSVFVRGLVEPTSVSERPLMGGLRVAAVFLQREFRCHQAQIEQTLFDRVRCVLDLNPGENPLPRANFGSQNPGQAIGAWLTEMLSIHRNVVPGAEDNRLLLCLDGLDEAAESTAVWELIPRPDELDPGVFVIVTSRLETGCPYWLWDSLQQRLASSDEDLVVHEVSLEDQGYRSLLHTYFKRELAGLMRRELDATLAHDFRQRGQFPDSGEICGAMAGSSDRFYDSGLVKATLRDASPRSVVAGLAQEWYSEVILPLEERFEQTFWAVLDRGKGLFHHVAHLCALLTTYDIKDADVAHLPDGGSLIGSYLAELDRILPEKEWGYLKRLLLTLASAEAAFARTAEVLGPHAGTPQTQGIPLPVLAGLMGEGTPTTRLVFGLYSLKEVLRVDRKHSNHAHYSLGLKDLGQDLRTVWPAAERAFHHRLAIIFYEQWADRWEELDSTEPTTEYLLLTLLAHADLSGDEKLRDRILEDGDLGCRLRKWATEVLERSNQDANLPFVLDGLTEGGALYGLSLAVFSALAENSGDDCWLYELAVTHVERAKALSPWLHTEVLSDLMRAIALLDDLRERLIPKGKWTVAWHQTLIDALRRAALQGYRTSTKKDLANSNEALERLSSLRLQTVSSEWQPEWQLSMAVAHTRHSHAQLSRQSLSAALVHANRAVEMLASLPDLPGRQSGTQGSPRDQYEGWWHRKRDEISEIDSSIFPGDIKALLAKAHLVRGNVLLAQEDLSRAIGEFESFVCLGGDFRDLSFEDGQDMVLVETYLRRGEIRLEEHQWTEAVADCGRVIDLLAEKRNDERAFWSQDDHERMATAHTYRANAYRVLDDLPGALNEYSTALRLWEELKENANPDWQPCSEHELNELLDKVLGLETSSDSEDGLAEDLSSYLDERPQPHDEDDDTWQILFAEAYVGRGMIFLSNNQALDAMNDLTCARELNRGLAAQWSARNVNGELESNSNRQAELHIQLARVESRLAHALVAHGDLGAAIGAFQSAHGIYDRLVRHERRTELADRLAKIEHDLGNAFFAQRDLDTAIGAFQRARGIFTHLVDQEGRTELANRLAEVEYELGNALHTARHLDAAIEAFQRARGIFERLVDQEGRTELADRLAEVERRLGIA